MATQKAHTKRTTEVEYRREGEKKSEFDEQRSHKKEQEEEEEKLAYKSEIAK